ncbi:MAG: hydroxymethylglutaryl-CoA lyase [Euzebya sp.]
MRTPQLVRDPSGDLPSAITIWEVGPRDGLQNESSVVPTAIKAEFIDRLVDAGHRVVEATSFVHPKWVPQLADATEVLGSITPAEGVRFPALVPNQRGMARAVECGVSDIAIFGSATESFARRNLNLSMGEQFEMFAPVMVQAAALDMQVRGYLSMCFGDPWEGDVAIDQVVSAGMRLLELGCFQLSLGDTIGVGTAGHVQALIRAFADAGVGPERLAVHFHDTYGQALSNTMAALGEGISVVDASAGGLGGCPYAESATGNLATEDLVWLLDGLGVHTGVDLQALVATSMWMAQHLGRPSPSRVVQALAGQEGPRRMMNV